MVCDWAKTFSSTSLRGLFQRFFLIVIIYREHINHDDSAFDPKHQIKTITCLGMWKKDAMQFTVILGCLLTENGETTRNFGDRNIWRKLC